MKVGDQVVDIQVYLEPLVGVSAPVLFLSFGYIDWFRPLLFGMIFTIGVLVGLELPLLMRILKEHVDFEDLVSRVLTFDYIGALLASLLFPILFVPHLGLVRTSLIFGILNALVGLWGTYLLRPLLKKKKIAGLRGRSALAIGLLVVGLIKADSLTSFAEEKQLAERIVHAESSPYQRIVITENQTGFQLFLNGHLQFSSNDEYRYHEALVHPVFSGEQRPQEVLVLGGGDGLAVREILKYPSVKSVTLVDLDPSMTSLADRFPPLADLARNALHDPRVKVINQDAFTWIDSDTKIFDAAIIDFPDPASYSVGKLYTTYFYKRLKRRLADRATIGIQCTSPLVAPQSYWCILRTMEESGFFVRSYHAAVPTFGIWGFALATLSPSEKDLHLSDVLTEPLRFLNQQVLEDLFVMPNDLVRVESEVNRLNDQVLVRYYDREWSRWQ